MIQRLQSLYLLFAALLVVLFLLFGDAWFAAAGTAFPWATPVALVLGGLTALVALAAVFLYKDRQMQRKVVSAAQWLDLALVLVVAGGAAALSFGDTGDTAGLGEATTAVYLSLLLPIIAYVFLRLARRGVEKDIALVRSMDRLR